MSIPRRRLHASPRFHANVVLDKPQCAHDENFAWLNRKDDGTTAVVLENPKTAEYQIVRTSLLPGLLKTVRENRKHALPLKMFEVADVVVKDDREERRARNIRRTGALYCGKKAGFEIVHGLLDRLMLMLDVENLGSASGLSKTGKAGYYIQQFDGGCTSPARSWTSVETTRSLLCADPTFFPDRAAKIFYRPATDSSTQSAHLMDTGASAANDIDTNVEAAEPAFTRAALPEGSEQGHGSEQAGRESRPKPSRPASALDTLKDKLLSALPGGTGSTGASGAAEAAKQAAQKDVEIGIMGILHPTVLRNFDVEYPCSVFEFTLEQL